MKQKFYEKDWFMWLMLVLFAPVGIFLMWKYKRFSNEMRKILTGVFAIWFLNGGMGNSSDNNDKNQQTKAIDVKQEQKIDKDIKEDKKLDIKLEEGIITKVVDGDTIDVKINNKDHRVRFIGVNTPESTTKIEPYGKEASDYTKNQLTGKTVYLEKDVSETDKYGRLLRYVWLDIPKEISDSEIRTKMYNANLVANGYAEVSTYPPDVKYQEYFTKYNEEARNANKGLWAINSNGTTKGDTTAKDEVAADRNNTTSSDASNSKKDNVVYITPSGKKYHKANCKTIKKSSSQISLQDAIGKGYTACKVCNP